MNTIQLVCFGAVFGVGIVAILSLERALVLISKEIKTLRLVLEERLPSQD
jgi:hypothetical protein